MLSRKHQLLAVAVMAALSLSACGKKKDLVSSEKPVVTKTDEKKGSEDTTLQGHQPGLGGGLEENTAELPPPPSLPGKKPKGSDLPPPPVLPKPPTHEREDQGQRPGSAPRVADVQPAPDLDSVDRLDNYESENDNIARGEKTSKRLTGGRTENGLLYTSASTDTLHETLRARNERVNESSKRLNMAAAASVTSASLSSSLGKAVVTIRVQEGNSEVVYKLSGAMGGALTSVQAGSTGTRPVDGSLQCVDFDADSSGSCENVFARLRLGAVGSSGIINIIFRQSNAGLFFDMPGQYSENSEYLAIHEYVVNSIRGDNTRNKIVRSRMNTWEVTNGRSGFTVTMKGGNNELMSFSGPLLAPQVGNGVSVVLSRNSSDGDPNSRTTLVNGIGEAKMIANNGLGQLQVVMKMRKRGNFQQDQFSVTFARKIKPVIDLK